MGFVGQGALGGHGLGRGHRLLVARTATYANEILVTSCCPPALHCRSVKTNLGPLAVA